MSATSTIHPSQSQLRITFAVLALGTGSYSLLQSLVSPVLPLLETNLHTTQSTVTWVLTAYLLAASVATPILGRLGDAFGKKRVLVGVLVALAAGSVLAALATSIGVMIVARVIQGIGGGVIPLAFGLLRDEFPKERVAGAVGSIAALLGVGGGVGLVLAGPIVNTFGYHWLFWLPAIVVAAVAVATHLWVPESSVLSPGRISWGAAVLLSGWLVALLLAVSQAPTWGWGSGKVIGLLVATVVLALAWATVENRSASPLIDLKMMRLTAVWTTNLVALLFGAGLYAVFAFLPEFVQTPTSSGYGFGASVSEAGLILLPLPAALFVFGNVSGRLSATVGSRKLLMAGSAISVLPFLIMTFAHSHIWEISVACLLLGAGFGLAFSAMSNIIVDAVPSTQTGVASGMNANIRTIGGSIGAAVMASIVTSGVHAGGLPKEGGYTGGFAMLAAVSALAALAAVLVPRLTSHRDEHQVEQAAMSHPGAALVAAATIVGDESE